MKHTRILKVLFFSWPLVEIAGFIVVGKWIGVLPTLLLVIALVIFGAVILRYQGLIQLYQLQLRMQRGEALAPQVLDNAMLMLAGFILLLPGFIKDIPALFLLFSGVRRRLLNYLTKKGWIHLPPQADHPVIEAEFWHDEHK